jgi:hypothetical protein
MWEKFHLPEMSACRQPKKHGCPVSFHAVGKLYGGGNFFLMYGYQDAAEILPDHCSVVKICLAWLADRFSWSRSMIKEV